MITFIHWLKQQTFESKIQAFFPVGMIDNPYAHFISFFYTFRTLHATWVRAKITEKIAWNKQTRLQTIKTHGNMCRRASVLFQRESHWKVWLSHFPLCFPAFTKIEWIFVFLSLIFNSTAVISIYHISLIVKDVESMERSHLWQNIVSVFFQ